MRKLGFINTMILLGCSVMSLSLAGQSYVPQSDQTIVASWTVPQSAQQPKAFVAQLLNDADLPGLASRYYGRASALLKPLLAADPDDLQLQYYQANVLQYYHQFSQAQQILNLIVQRQPDNVSAWLMKANIHLVQGELAQAKSACLQLLGQGSLVISAACALQVSAEQGSVKESYGQLQNVLKTAGEMPDDQKLWVQQILADLAQRQQLGQQALQHLGSYPLSKAPVSYLALWADIQLEQYQGQRVLDTLGPIVQDSDSFDDALLLRLALAEKTTQSTSHLWKTRLTQRIEIRLQRKDTAHAADIARYYLDINPSAEKALYWAKINWQQAKLTPDGRLLQRAMNVQYAPAKQDTVPNRT